LFNSREADGWGRDSNSEASIGDVRGETPVARPQKLLSLPRIPDPPTSQTHTHTHTPQNTRAE